MFYKIIGIGDNRWPGRYNGKITVDSILYKITDNDKGAILVIRNDGTIEHLVVGKRVGVVPYEYDTSEN